MFENNIDSIKKAQAGDKNELENIIVKNSRFNMEYSKKI